MSEPLNILIANSGRRWIGEVGHCVMLYDALRARGHRVWLACRRGHRLDQYAAERGMDRLALHCWSRPSWRDAADIARLRRFIRENRIDLVHAHRGKDHYLSAVACALTGTPLVRTRHVVTPVGQQAANRWLYARATDAVICVSGAADRSLGLLGERIARRRVILSAVDPEAFHPRRRSQEWRQRHLAEGFEGEPVWIGMIARFQNIKGQRVFLEAAAQIAARYPQAHFFLAGRGSQSKRRRFRDFAERRGFGDRLAVEGMLDDVGQAMASLDIGVVASLGSEGSSRATLEMMASGVPVVATRVGGIPELMEGGAADPGDPEANAGAAGFLVDPGDADAMARVWAMLIERADLRRAMGEAGRRRAETRHNPDRWAAEMEAVYREVMGVRRPKP